MSHIQLFSFCAPSRRHGQPPGGDEWSAERAALSLWRSRFRDSQGQWAEHKRPSQVCLYVLSCIHYHYAVRSLCGQSVTLCVSSVFLSSELQAAQVVRSREVSHKQHEDSPLCQELLVICETLNLPEPRGQDAAGVFSQIQDKVGLFHILGPPKLKVFVVTLPGYNARTITSICMLWTHWLGFILISNV